jgi:hypothetical protein
VTAARLTTTVFEPLFVLQGRPLRKLGLTPQNLSLALAWTTDRRLRFNPLDRDPRLAAAWPVKLNVGSEGNRRAGEDKGSRIRKNSAWDRRRRKARFVASVVFTLARLFIHPSSPQRQVGNELWKVTSEPLPSRFVTFVTTRDSKRAHDGGNAGRLPTPTHRAGLTITGLSTNIWRNWRAANTAQKMGFKLSLEPV